MSLQKRSFFSKGLPPLPSVFAHTISPLLCALTSPIPGFIVSRCPAGDPGLEWWGVSSLGHRRGGGGLTWGIQLRSWQSRGALLSLGGPLCGSGTWLLQSLEAGAFMGTKVLQPCPCCSKSFPNLVPPMPSPPWGARPDCTTAYLFLSSFGIHRMEREFMFTHAEGLLHVSFCARASHKWCLRLYSHHSLENRAKGDVSLAGGKTDSETQRFVQAHKPVCIFQLIIHLILQMFIESCLVLGSVASTVDVTGTKQVQTPAF